MKTRKNTRYYNFLDNGREFEVCGGFDTKLNKIVYDIDVYLSKNKLEGQYVNFIPESVPDSNLEYIDVSEFDRFDSVFVTFYDEVLKFICKTKPLTEKQIENMYKDEFEGILASKIKVGDEFPCLVDGETEICVKIEKVERHKPFYVFTVDFGDYGKGHIGFKNRARIGEFCLDSNSYVFYALDGEGYLVEASQLPL